MDDLRRVAADLWSEGRGWILITVSAGWFLSMGTRFAYPALIPYFVEEFQLNFTISGLLVTVLWSAYAIGQFPGGILSDRLGEYKLLVFSTGLSAATILLISLSGSFVLLLLGTVTFGVATALYGPARFTILTNIYPARTGTAVGLTMAAGNVGNSVVPPLLVGITAISSWRTGFSVMVPLFTVSMLGLWWKLPKTETTADNAVDSFSLDTLYRIASGIRQEGVVIVLLVQIFTVFAYQAFIGLFPTYLVDIKGFAPQTAAVVFGLFFITSVLFQMLSGAGMDYVGSKTMILGLLGTFAVSLVLLTQVGGYAPIVLVTVLLSSRAGIGVVNNTYVADILPEDMKGTGLGLLRMGWILLAAPGPVIIGIFADKGLFDTGYLFLAGIVGIGMLLSLLLPSNR